MDFEPLMDALKDAIRAVWPETLPNGIHEGEHEATIAYSTKKTPFASLITGPWQPAQWGKGNFAQEGPVSLCYTMRTKGPNPALRAKLTAMETYLRDHRSLGTGQRSGRVSIGYGVDVPPNAPLRATNLSQRVGAVRFQVLIGEIRQTTGPYAQFPV